MVARTGKSAGPTPTSSRPVRFATAAAFRAWLQKNHARARAIVLRCARSHAAHAGITRPQAVDEALCFGWIDGVVRRLDDSSFSARFSPRTRNSTWSAINLRRAAQLEADGRMRPAGTAAFRAGKKARRKPGARRYLFESRPRELGRAYAAKLRANKRAWAFFQKQAPWYRRISKLWVMTAKQEATRARRLGLLIASSARGATLGPLTSKKPS